MFGGSKLKPRAEKRDSNNLYISSSSEIIYNFCSKKFCRQRCWKACIHFLWIQGWMHNTDPSIVYLCKCCLYWSWVRSKISYLTCTWNWIEWWDAWSEWNRILITRMKAKPEKTMSIGINTCSGKRILNMELFFAHQLE